MFGNSIPKPYRVPPAGRRVRKIYTGPNKYSDMPHPGQHPKTRRVNGRGPTQHFAVLFVPAVLDKWDKPIKFGGENMPDTRFKWNPLPIHRAKKVWRNKPLASIN